jgi:sodium/potassium-transporting ATPase subunit alpha
MVPYLAHIIFAIPLPLNLMLMLVICIGTDVLPALSLAVENSETDIMVRSPRTKNERLLTASLVVSSYLQMGVIGCAGGFYAFFTTMHWYGFDIMGMFQH